MELDHLGVVHYDKRRHGEFAHAPRENPFLDSCQRKVWIYGDCQAFETSDAFESFRGEAAYGFLLRVITGLESAVVAETDIFGQFKEAWLSYERASPKAAISLAPWMQKLFEDAKEIRSTYLQNVGGSSYGTLVRKLLNLRSEDRILIAGAGKIASSVAPYLVDHEILLWNRTPARLDRFEHELLQAGATRVRRLTDEQSGWMEADHVVVCMPLQPAQDSLRVSWRLASQKTGRVLHLGCLRGEATETWERLPEHLSLNDVFDLKASQSNVRDTQIERARKACHERARLRRLGRSLSIAHGWEDLAVFN